MVKMKNKNAHHKNETLKDANKSTDMEQSVTN